MGSEFWRTIRLAIERDTWTARLVVLCLAAGVFWACVRVTTAGWPSASPGEAPHGRASWGPGAFGGQWPGAPEVRVRAGTCVDL